MTRGVGGTGGGGTGANGSISPVNGTTNTGGGGGGGGTAGGYTGGIGGSGIVVIRYSDLLPAATATTGSPTITVTGGFRIYQFTGSGSITF
jgi:hypothetical protein